MIKGKQWVSLELSTLRKAEWNYKGEDPDKTASLIENIRRNGQVENVIVRELADGLFEVVNGNHRIDAFVALGVEQVICYNVGEVTTAAAQRLAVETNETRFERDGLKLSQVIKSIVEEFPINELEVTMPFGGDEIDAMAKMADFDWDSLNTGQKEDGEDDDAAGGGGGGGEPLTCPECGHVFPDKR